MLTRLFSDHPKSVGETYVEHMATALAFAAIMGRTSLALMVHALVPGLFVKTGSRAMNQLYGRMIKGRAHGVIYMDNFDFVI